MEIWTCRPTTFTVLTRKHQQNLLSPIVVSSNGFNALAVNNNYVYYCDGTRVTGTVKSMEPQLRKLLATLGSTKSKGGIAVDDCDNIYIRDNGSMHILSMETPSPQLDLYHLNASSSNPIVYDIAPTKTPKPFVCGNGFVGN